MGINRLNNNIIICFRFSFQTGFINREMHLGENTH